MERIPVASSNVASVGYDSDANVMEVEFHRSGIYQYFGVPPDVHEGLMTAGSKGRFFDQYVKKAGYPCARVG